MYYSKIDPMSVVDGDGCRVTLFVSGCRNHCKGCFNEATWNFTFGQEFTDADMDAIVDACSHDYIAGLTILGGEPFEQENQPEVLRIIREFRKRCQGKNLWLYTGYIVDRDLLPGQRKYVAGTTMEILKEADMLVDGPFVLEKRDLTLLFRGSSNQRLLDREQLSHIIL